MFGSALVSMQKYMEEKLGPEKWSAMLIKAGLPANKVFRTVYFYPDPEFKQLLKEGALMAGMSEEALQRDLGEAFGKFLLKTYSIMFFPSWRALDVIEKAAPKVFKTIQMIDPYTPKSSVKSVRIASDEVIVHYQSPRQMCSYIMGIIDAMGKHFNEKLEINHLACMHKGAPECLIHVKLIHEQPSQ